MAGAPVSYRAATPSFDAPVLCHTPGCQRPTQHSAGKGFSALYCKVHVAFHARHGSYWHRSYLASELTPYGSASRRWLRTHKKDSLVNSVIAALSALLAGSGKPESAYDLRYEPPAEKARIALARLHAAGTPGSRLLEITLAVSARVNDRGPCGQEFLEVQIAKLAHRLASGTHRTTSGIPMRSKYAPSSGRVLRILGHRIWDIAAVAADSSAVEEVIQVARPAVAIADASEAKRKAAEELVASEIMRVSTFGMGPQRLAKYERQMRRLHGLE